MCRPHKQTNIWTNGRNVRQDYLKLVIVSDTHGYESSLTKPTSPKPISFLAAPQPQQPPLPPQTTSLPLHTPDPIKPADVDGQQHTTTTTTNLLPEGDVLLHLGDFAVDGGTQKQRLAILEFDEWLSRQPQRTKLIVRGNHDPLVAEFPKSGAHYVSLAPETFFLEQSGGTDTENGSGDPVVITLIPYGTKVGGYNKKHTRNKNAKDVMRGIPPCDILATHVPPHQILDRRKILTTTLCNFDDFAADFCLSHLCILLLIIS